MYTLMKMESRCKSASFRQKVTFSLHVAGDGERGNISIALTPKARVMVMAVHANKSTGSFKFMCCRYICMTWQVRAVRPRPSNSARNARASFMAAFKGKHVKPFLSLFGHAKEYASADCELAHADKCASLMWVK